MSEDIHGGDDAQNSLSGEIIAPKKTLSQRDEILSCCADITLRCDYTRTHAYIQFRDGDVVSDPIPLPSMSASLRIGARYYQATSKDAKPQALKEAMQALCVRACAVGEKIEEPKSSATAAPDVGDIADALSDEYHGGLPTKRETTRIAKVIAPPVQGQRADETAATNLHLGNVIADCLRKKTDASAATVFAKRANGKLLYNYDDKAWMHYDGTRWLHDRAGKAMAHAKVVARYIADAANKLEDENERRAGLGYALNMESRKNLEAMVSLSKDLLPTTNEAFDRDPLALNLQNGTLDLRTRTLRKHDSADRITKLAPVPYDPAATCPRWDQFLTEITLGDKEMIAYLCSYIGYALTGDVKEHVFPILYGGGANGKTTFVETVRAILGDYACDCDVQLFIAQRERGATPDVARLKGVRLATASELPEGQQLAERKVKSLTGGDKIPARRLYGEFFEFAATHKFLISTNHKPVILGDDNGIWRRIKLVPFLASFEGEKTDPNLKTKLESELPGILAWALEGCMSWQRDGLPMPKAVKLATDKYRAGSDAFTAFLDEHCILGPNHHAKASLLYDAYARWHNNGRENSKLLTVWQFNDKLRERGLDGRISNGLVFDGIGFRNFEHTEQTWSNGVNGGNSGNFPSNHAREENLPTQPPLAPLLQKSAATDDSAVEEGESQERSARTKRGAR